MPTITHRPFVIRIDENEVQQCLGEMIEMVRGERWCRGLEDDGHRGCALGLAHQTAPSEAVQHAVVRALDSAITPRLASWPRREPQPSLFDELQYESFDSRDHVARNNVAQYNDTRKREREIIAWFETARQLA